MRKTKMDQSRAEGGVADEDREADPCKITGEGSS